MSRSKKLSAPPPPRKARVVIDPPMAPAKITPDMVKDRGYRGNDGRPSNNKAWRRLSPIQKAFGTGKITRDQFDAGQRYADLYDLSQPSGRDSTQALNLLGRSGKGGGTLSQAQSEALDDRETVEFYMDKRDRAIIRLVCGEGEQPAAAVKQACGGGYKFAAIARLQEALDALIEAFDAMKPAKREPDKKVA